MTTFFALTVLPVALVLDCLFGELQNRWHPLCWMGNSALWLEKTFRHSTNSVWLYFAGCLATLLTILPFLVCLIFLMQFLQKMEFLEWVFTVLVVYFCLAPRSLGEHAQRVARPLIHGDLNTAKQAVSMIVGRETAKLDAYGVARACVESVAENLTDGVIATMFWAIAGLLIGSYLSNAGWSLNPFSEPLVCFDGYFFATCFVIIHRVANTLDALWGKKNDKYRYFGTCAARLDDVCNFIPARMAFFCIALTAYLLPRMRGKESLRIGWKYRYAHESPNSAWSEAAFAGALGLQLGGPAVYKGQLVNHPWLGEGTPKATFDHIYGAILLLHGTVFTTLVVCEVVIGMVGKLL